MDFNPTDRPARLASFPAGGFRVPPTAPPIPRFSHRLLPLLLLLALTLPAAAQRQMENLGRGLVAVRRNSTQASLSWRLLATDPPDIGFNLYRTSGGVTTKLNSLPLTNTTDHLDTPVFTGTNAWFVRPVLNGVEQAASAPAHLPANPPIRQYLPIPLPPVAGGNFPPYDVKFAWVGDFDGDGEYDFVVDRLSTVAATNQFLQAIRRDGTFLWQMNLGHNSVNQYSHEPGSSAISVGMGDGVTVYDLDGDGKAEVIVRTANGVTVTNAAGVRVASVTHANDNVQFISVFDGLTGVERGRVVLTNQYLADGPLNGHMGILYCDGVRPSVVFQSWNRVGDGPFNFQVSTFDFRTNTLTHRWTWQAGQNDHAEGHQIRLADVDGDGRDDFLEIGHAVGADGQLLWDNELVHGDRHHTSDLDPDRPGLETYAIQQNNPTLLATALYDSATGAPLHKKYAGGVVDVGRGIAIDIDPNHRGTELFSTQFGIYNVRGELAWAQGFWPSEGVWWDGDVLREFITAADGNGYNPVINKFNPVNGFTNRLYTLYSEGVHQAYGARAAFWGDLLGDWREELVLVANDYSEIRIYTTTTPATNRLYCLMQNPAYRLQATTKGYYQANYPDFFLGAGMEPPGPPPVSAAQLTWRGGGANVWDTTTAHWFTNGLWISNTTPAAFWPGAHVLFDLTGSNHAAVQLATSLSPGSVTVHSPRNKDYTFGGPGGLAGDLSLTKAGRGKLTLAGTNTFTGPTTVWEGPLLVNGALPASPVTVRGGVWHEGALAGHGFVGNGATVHRHGSVSPGAGGASPGTLTIANGLTLQHAALRFDLSDDPTGTAKTNDQLVILGPLTLHGTNRIVIHRLNGVLPPGAVYPLVSHTGALVGSLDQFVIEGLPGLPVALTNPPGQLALVVKNHRPPATLTWTGGQNGNVWDLLASSNFLNGAARDQFAPFDTVRFTDVGASNPVVTLAGELNAGHVVVDSAASYTFAGNGVLMGGAGLTKSNTGTLTLTAKQNTFTGRTLLAGGTLVVSELGAVGAPGALGNPPGGVTNLVLANSPTLRVTEASYTDRGMTLNPGSNTLEVASSGGQLTMAGQLVGAGLLRKTGPGTLALTTSNAHTGGTLIQEGTVALGGVLANQRALGTGPVTLAGGTLRMYDDNDSWETCAWNLNVPAGQTGTVIGDSRCTLTGTLTGSGTLNFVTPYVRTEINGNWSAFTGRINVTTTAANGDFRVLNTTGFGNAHVDLGANVWAYQTAGGAVAIGELTGAPGATLSSGAWTLGARNNDSTYRGRITGTSLTKTGAGTLTLTGTNSYNGVTAINAGRLLVNGVHTGTNTLTVAAAGTLGGFGALTGNTLVHGRLEPGSNSVGTLTFSNRLTLNPGSLTVLEIRKTPFAHDRVVAGGLLTFGGTLAVTNLAGPLAAGDVFPLFSAGGFTNTFAALQLPPPDAGLAWDTSQLAVNGTLRVLALTPPALATPQLVGNQFLCAATNGTPHRPCVLLGTTNLTLSPAHWTRLATNTLDSLGNTTFTTPLNFTQPAWFLRALVE